MDSDYRLDFHQRRLYYLEQGQGETVLILHGNGADARMYRPLIEALSPHYRVLVPDLPGYGHSATLYESKMPRYLEQIESFINHHIDKPFYLIGHSLGGMLAYQIQLRRKIPQVKRAIWMEAAIFNLDWKLRLALPAYARLLVSKGHNRRGIEARMREWSWDYDNGDKLTSEAFIQSYYASNIQVHGMFLTEAASLLPYRFAEITEPVLCLRGEKEHVVSRATSWFAPQLPNAKLQIIPQAGHFLLGENNQALCEAILEFLALPEGLVEAPLALSI